MKKITVDKKYNNKKLSLFLMDTFNGLILNNFYKALRKKDILVNDHRVNKNIILHENDNVILYIKDELLFKNFNLSIIYEDNNILIINKPVGIEVLSSNIINCSLTYFVNKYCIDNLKILEPTFPYPCHRIDRNTCGLVLFAKNKFTLNFLINKFKNNEIEKKYLCKVYGIPSKKEDILTAYLFKDAKKSIVNISIVPKKNYQKIITSYKILKEDIINNTCILEITLHTGKTHQIRSHLAYIGFPIIGDRKIWN